MIKFRKLRKKDRGRLACVLLGANGDVCACLPYLKHYHDTTGQKPIVLISEHYRPILDGVSYVEPVVAATEYTRTNRNVTGLRRCVDEISKRHRGIEIIYLNPISTRQWINARTPSFVVEMWKMLGVQELWDTLPLVFDLRDREREGGLVSSLTGNRPLILIGVDGVSSKFPNTDHLKSRIRREFPDHQVLDLSTVSAERVYDLLGLYDKAVALITSDTVHAHLCHASKVPTLVWANDKKNRWRGVACSSRYAWHGRYGEYHERVDEMIDSLRGVVESGVPQIEIIQGLAKGGYNPTITQDGRLLAYRYHPLENWHTRITAARMNGSKVEQIVRIATPGDWDRFSVEDPRFFTHQNKLMMSATLAVPVTKPPPRCAVAYAEVSDEGSQLRLVRHHFPDCGQNDFTGLEKNWLFFSWNDRLFVLYKAWDEQVVIELDGSKVVKEHRSPALPWKYGNQHGGTQFIEKDGLLLSFFHSHVTDRERKLWRYYMGAVLREPQPPFRQVAISRSPIFIGNEKYVPGHHHWKPNIIFPAGARFDGTNYLVYVGINDCQTAIMKLTDRDLKL